MSKIHQAHGNNYHQEARAGKRRPHSGTPKAGDQIPPGRAAELAKQDPPFGPVEPNLVAVDILHFNDLHRQMEPTKAHLGGVPELAGLINKMKEEMPDAIVVNLGDVAYGKGPIEGPQMFVPIPELFNEMGVSLLELGNHELQDPKNNYKALHETLINKLDAEVLCGNLTDAKTGQPLEGVKPYSIKQLQGMNIAFIGIVTRDLATSAHPSVGAGLKVANLDATLLKLVPEVRAKGADAVVVMAHESFNDMVNISERVGGIDATLAAHDHKATPDAAMVRNPDGKTTLVTEAGSHGTFLGHLRIVMDPKTRQVVRVEDRLIPVDGSVPVDPEVEAIVQAYSKSAA